MAADVASRLVDRALKGSGRSAIAEGPEPESRATDRIRSHFVTHRLPSYDSAMHKGLSVLRYLWAAPTTALGLLVVLAGLWRARARVVEGVLEAQGPMLAWLLTHLTRMPGGAAALTLGHVVIARDRRSLEETRAHERVHVHQCETWGPLFVPAYLTASLWAVWCGRNFYFDNRFEVEAFQMARVEHAAQSAGRRKSLA